MKKLLIGFAVMALSVPCSAQWTTSGNNTIHTNSGGVGIGTANPLTLFDVKLTNNQHIQFVTNVNGGYFGAAGIVSINDENTAYTPLGFYASNYYLGGGKVGIGTNSPNSLLEIKGDAPYITINGTNNNLFKGINFATNGDVQASVTSNIQTGEMKFKSGSAGFGGFITYDLDGIERMRIQANTGNVGIGTPDPRGYKLAVAGNFISESVTVRIKEQWPDYVFKPSYKLPSLAKVKAYIDKNNHLPDMPSEAEVAKEGVNLGEMNKQLLKKVEELTLYMIEMQDQLKLQNEKIRKLERVKAKN